MKNKKKIVKNKKKKNEPIVFDKEVKKVDNKSSLKEDSILSIQTEKTNTNDNNDDINDEINDTSNLEKRKTIKIN